MAIKEIVQNINFMKRTRKLSEQVKAHLKKPIKKATLYDGNTETMISTGSTLLDLAISGGRKRGGGIPGGILVEIFGPSGSGKTVLLCEIAGAVQRQGGAIMFHDPEARLDKQFAKIFDLDVKEKDYSNPNTIPEVFKAVRGWPGWEGMKEINQIKEIKGPSKRENFPLTTKAEPKVLIHGIFADSLAALSTDLEMDNEEGDKMGMRRAKEFSEELRKTCRILAKNNYLMVCSNQIRQTTNQFGPKYKSPGGEAVGFYSSLRLRAEISEKIKEKVKIAGKEVTRIIGVQIQVEVFKSSIWKPYRTAPITILFDYGIDDVRENLQFIKDFSNNTVYTINNADLDKSMGKSIQLIEENEQELELKEQVIDLWEEIESKFESERKPKIR